MADPIDAETKQDLFDAFLEHYSDIEEGLTCLHDASEEQTIAPEFAHQDAFGREQLDLIFRAIHSVKGNASMCGYTDIVDFAHAIEEVAQGLRSGDLFLSPKICETIQLGMDRLRDMHDMYLWGKTFDELHLPEIQEFFHELGSASQSEADGVASSLLYFVSGREESDYQTEEAATVCSVSYSDTTVSEEKKYEDLIFFQQLSFKMDNQNDYWFGRTIQLFDWTQKINLIGGEVINHEQLAAATYLHDIGMVFVPRHILLKTEELTTDDREEIKRHAFVGVEYLSRIPGWEEASKMIAQHHEWVNGTGYPMGLSGPDIHPGAKILAIVDAFFSIMNGRADRTNRRSVVRAISEVNSQIDIQFDQYWVNCFNDMIREESRNGNL